MNGMEALAAQVRWVGRNFAHNLWFIPANRLDWKPSPTANSALEIVQHSAACMGSTLPVMRGEPFREWDRPAPRDAAAAEHLIREVAEEFAGLLEGLTPAELDRTVILPHGTMTLRDCASWEATDLVHHHGQIAYLQALLGDPEGHYFDRAPP